MLPVLLLYDTGCNQPRNGGINEMTTPCQSDFSLRTCDLSPSVRNAHLLAAGIWKATGRPGVRPHHPGHCGNTGSSVEYTPSLLSIIGTYFSLATCFDGEQSLVQIGPEGSTETFLITANQFSLTPTCKDYGWISRFGAGGRIISRVTDLSQSRLSHGHLLDARVLMP
jgi:hypothetical protein